MWGIAMPVGYHLVHFIEIKYCNSITLQFHFDLPIFHESVQFSIIGFDHLIIFGHPRFANIGEINYCSVISASLLITS